ncbi:MAG: hypothetical protein KGL38_05825 [Gemmatimonadota bacterium]|nr:hypothetical protein [Gemmatimonadota bacterium]MDE3173686.1 hypothetical protein [Gemmatimonadota bacterium]MDE3215580.1 hypothetical protein [Gemmatimonadota bacterium]
MTRLSNPGCMLRATSALFGVFFLPVGLSFFFVLRHRHWPEGVGAVLASLAFFYVAWKADDILGLERIDAGPDLQNMESLIPPRPPAAHEEPPP